MRMLLALPALIALFAFAACGDDEGGGGKEVSVTLQEFEVALDKNSVDAGEITFNVENKGPDDVHEFVIIKTDLDPGALPTIDDGSVDEAGEGMEVIDEIEDIPVGDKPSLVVTLEAGKYVLICNIVEEVDGATESHYKEGMRTALTVK